MASDPASAPPRPDLTFLRRRSKPRTAAPPAAGPPAASPPAGGDPISFDRPGRAPAGSSSLDLSGDAPAAAPAPATPSISFERPGRAPAGSSSLDLSGDPTAPASEPSSVRPPAPPSTPTQGGGHPISFDRPGRGPSASSGASGSARSSSLDLSDAPAAATNQPSAARPTPPAVRQLGGERVRAGQQQLLTVTDPTVLLTRVQSGVGMFEIEAACSADVGDLRIGAAYALASGHTSTVQLAGDGNRFAPSSRRPVIVAGRDEFEHLRVDLRQIRDLQRMAVYAFSESRAELAWGGTLVMSTSAGARTELPLESLYRGRIAVLVSLYVVDGEILLRAEMETIGGDVREAARAYGFDRITWRDDRTPVDP